MSIFGLGEARFRKRAHHGTGVMPEGGLEFERPSGWKGGGVDQGDRAEGMKCR